MRRSVLATVALAAATVVATPPARGQQTAEGFAVNRFEPSERGAGWFSLDQLDFRGGVRPAIGVVGDYQYRPLVISKNDTVVSSIVRNQLAFHLGASGVFDRFRGGLSLPFTGVGEGRGGVVGGVRYDPPAHNGALGDLRLAFDARLLGTHDDVISLAAGLRAWLPTGSKASYMGDGDLRLSPHLLLAGGRGVLAYAGRFGLQYRGRDDAFGASRLGSEMIFGLSAGARLAGGDVLVGPEIQGSSLLNADFLSGRATPVLGLLGAHATAGDLRVGGGVGTGLSPGLGTPEFRALLSIEWSPAIVLDRDLDGVLDDHDACPDTKGVETSDPRTSGCAPPPMLPPSDGDGDGILDREDVCPEIPGDVEWEGCPADRDRDGIPDKEDACPADAGIRTDDAKTSGCPDRDGDGLFDRDDACKDSRGLRSEDPAKNGCPDGDRDRDGIKDGDDACPDVPGDPSTDTTRNGCPRVELKEKHIRLVEPIAFRGDTATIDGDDTLRAVARLLRLHPEIRRVRIEGHTDNRAPAEKSRKLSVDRAAAVTAWLESNGIERRRLTAVGHGGTRPLVDNTSEGNRHQNRRIEIWIEAATDDGPPTAVPGGHRGGRHKGRGGGKKR